jgi:putative MFS transporter
MNQVNHVAAPSDGPTPLTPYQKRLFFFLSVATLFEGYDLFALAERGMSDAQVGAILTVAAVAAMPLVFLAGKLLDLIGRRLGALVIFTMTALGVLGSYTLRIPLALTGALVLGIFGASAVLPVLNAFTAELFPTELRSEAYALSNNVLGRLGYLVSPLLVGLAADTFGWGPTVAATATFPLLVLGVIWAVMPETVGRELEETSAVSGNAMLPSEGTRKSLSGASQDWS